MYLSSAVESGDKLRERFLGAPLTNAFYHPHTTQFYRFKLTRIYSSLDKQEAKGWYICWGGFVVRQSIKKYRVWW